MPIKKARTPEECCHLLAEFLLDGDLDAIVSLYEPGATFVTRTREVRTGHDAIRAAFAELAATKPRLTCNVVLVLRNGNNLALLYNDWSMRLTGPDGQQTETNGKAIETACRQSDGAWRYAIDDPFGRM